jgi:cob(I)alamin adenosyltransferase
VLGFNYLPTDEIVGVLTNKHVEQSIAVTGRGAPQALIDAADTVTEMKCIKHAFDAGVQARRGIEF